MTLAGLIPSLVLADALRASLFNSNEVSNMTSLVSYSILSKSYSYSFLKVYTSTS
jgi:hypothetical protein